MIGGPLSRNGGVAEGLRAGLFVVFCGLFLWQIAIPAFASRQIDRNVAALFALVGFLFSRRGGAAWSRTALGVAYALSWRYATPMLLLWMALFALLIRIFTVAPGRPRFASVGIWLAIVAAFGIVAEVKSEAGRGAGIDRPVDVYQSGCLLRRIRRGGHMAQLGEALFAPGSDVEADRFPSRQSFEHFRKADGVCPCPRQIKSFEQAPVASLSRCARGAVDHIARVRGADLWEVDSGWAADDLARAAVDFRGRQRGPVGRVHAAPGDQ